MDTLAVPSLPPDNTIDSSVSLAIQVKTYGQCAYHPKAYKEQVITRTGVVTEYNSALFLRKCNPASSEYDNTISLDVYAHELFKDKEVWAKRDGLLDDALEDLVARVRGFVITKDSTSIYCNRRGTMDTTRNYVGGHLGVGCNSTLS
jgi:hypothetical protein